MHIQQMARPISYKNLPKESIPISIRLSLRTGEVQDADVGHEVSRVGIVLNVFDYSLSASTFGFVVERRGWLVHEGIIKFAGGVSKGKYF